MSKSILLIGIFFLATACHQNALYPEWQIVYKNDEEGNTLIGDKSALVQAVRAGQDVKIGWGHQGKSHTIEHLSLPIWIAVLDGTEVIARLDPQVGGKVNWENLASDYSENEVLDTEWRVILTTEGAFDAVWIDRKDFEVKRRVPQIHPISWFVRRSPGNTIEAKPLYDEEKE